MLKKFYAVFAVIVLTLAVVGCGGSSKGKVQEYLDKNTDATVQEQFNAMASTYGEGSTFTMKGEGDDKLIMEFKLGSNVDESVFNKETLTATLDSLAVVFEPMADSFKTDMGVNKMTITVKFLDSSGTELASKSFDSK